MSGREKTVPKTRVELTHRALEDVRAIERFSSKKWGRKVADRYLDEISHALDRIQENPGILRLEPDFSNTIYFYRVRSHYLACDLQDHLVIVLTVLHTSMDLPARLQELEPQLIAEAQFLHDRIKGESRR